MNKQLAFILGVFPLFFITFFGIMLYLLSKGLLTIGISTPANETFFITFVFSFPLGMWASLIVDKLRGEG